MHLPSAELTMSEAIATLLASVQFVCPLSFLFLTCSAIHTFLLYLFSSLSILRDTNNSNRVVYLVRVRLLSLANVTDWECVESHHVRAESVGESHDPPKAKKQINLGTHQKSIKTAPFRIAAGCHAPDEHRLTRPSRTRASPTPATPMTNLRRHLRGFDAFARNTVPDELRRGSASGGVISVVSFLVILVLFISELVSFLSLTRTTHLTVDNDDVGTLRVHIDVDLPYLNCEVLGLDAADVSGNAQLEITHNVFKTPIDHNGRALGEKTRIQPHNGPSPTPFPNGCGSCMGAETEPGQCCNTCDSVKLAYEKRGWMLLRPAQVPQCVREGRISLTPGEFDPDRGCNIHGTIDVLKVAGTLRITPGHSFTFLGRAIHDLSAMRNHDINLSHRFKKVAFGDFFPGQTNSLDGIVKEVGGKQKDVGQHEYFVKVVPTTYKRAWGSVLNTNQYSVTKYFRKLPQDGNSLPGIFLFYDMSPIRVNVVEETKNPFHFLVQLCAIIGGVFTVAGLISQFVDDVLLRTIEKRRTGKII